MQFFAVEVLELLRLAPRLRQFFLEFADAGLKLPVLGHQQPHPFFDLRKFVFKVRQMSFPL